MQKILDVTVWLLVLGTMGWLAYGCYALINLFFIRG
jgi:TRAP-type C4-dicarboxylate transport system permease small subunit